MRHAALSTAYRYMPYYFQSITGITRSVGAGTISDLLGPCVRAHVGIVDHPNVFLATCHLRYQGQPLGCTHCAFYIRPPLLQVCTGDV